MTTQPETAESLLDAPLRGGGSKLIIAKGKHDDVCYAVNNRRELLLAYVLIIRGWNSMGYLPTPQIEWFAHIDKEDKEILDMSAEDIEKLPTVFQEKAKKLKQRYSSALHEYEEAKRYHKFAQAILEAESLDEAVNLFRDRKGTSGRRIREYYIESVIRYYGDHEYMQVEESTLEPLEW